MEKRRQVIESYHAPINTNTLWLDSNDSVLKKFENGEWVPLTDNGGNNSITYIDFHDSLMYLDNGEYYLKDLNPKVLKIFNALKKVRDLWVENKPVSIAYLSALMSSGPSTYCYSNISYYRMLINGDDYNMGELSDINATNVPDYIIVNNKTVMAPFAISVNVFGLGTVAIICKYYQEDDDYCIIIYRLD